MAVIEGKNVVLGVTGGIAAYKSAELVRKLVRNGAHVDVIMTDSAVRFVSPLTFQTLSGNPVTTDLFRLYRDNEIAHVSLADRADIMVVAPATANIIGKAACGIADDMLSSVLVACSAPVLFAPAMNVNMWKNPVVQDNVRRLKEYSRCFINPQAGELACGVEGEGRLADPEDILDEIMYILSPKDFKGRKVLVTAGPTHEYIDPVRYVSNPSSGKTGFAIARALVHRGADVTLVSGPTSLLPPRKVSCVRVTTAEQMATAVMEEFRNADMVIMTAAVSDYRPSVVSPEKMKKEAVTVAVEMERTTDILSELGRRKGDRIIIGFAAETQDIKKNALGKLKAKNLDMIIANDVSRSDIGFGSNVNEVSIFTASGSIMELPCMEKQEIAHRILDCMTDLINR